jgi:hypothetical protein
MTRVRMLVTTAIPALLVGALVGHAAPGSNDGYWSSSGGVIVADNDAPKRKRIPPGPPVGDIWSDSADTPPMPPEPPHPPHPPRAPRAGGGVSISVDGNQINITGIDELVNEHLESVTKMLRNNPRVPKAVRDKIGARMDKVRGIVEKRLKNVNKRDLDKLEAEVEKLEGELESALEGLDEDLKDLGKQLGKDLAKQIKGQVDDDDDDTDHDDVDVDADPVVITDLGDIMLKPAQRDALQKLRTQSDARVAAQKQLLERASDKLEAALADPKTSTADVERLVDQVSGHEAAIRKARLVAWVEARRLLDADQVKKLEQAAGAQHP